MKYRKIIMQIAITLLVLFVIGEFVTYIYVEAPLTTDFYGSIPKDLVQNYNNDTLFIHGLLLLFKVWLDKESYNDTLVLFSDNPYDFGVYRGKARTPNIVAALNAHAPEWVYVPDTKQWYITTCGWKWVATLTSGQVAIAPVKWERVE